MLHPYKLTNDKRKLNLGHIRKKLFNFLNISKKVQFIFSMLHCFCSKNFLSCFYIKYLSENTIELQLICKKTFLRFLLSFPLNVDSKGTF